MEVFTDSGVALGVLSAETAVGHARGLALVFSEIADSKAAKLVTVSALAGLIISATLIVRCICSWSDLSRSCIRTIAIIIDPAVSSQRRIDKDVLDGLAFVLVAELRRAIAVSIAVAAISVVSERLVQRAWRGTSVLQFAAIERCTVDIIGARHSSGTVHNKIVEVSIVVG